MWLKWSKVDYIMYFLYAILCFYFMVFIDKIKEMIGSFTYEVWHMIRCEQVFLYFFYDNTFALYYYTMLDTAIFRLCFPEYSFNVVPQLATTYGLEIIEIACLSEWSSFWWNFIVFLNLVEFRMSLLITLP